MAISVNYTTPIYVNGYLCKNCTDVDEAKKHVDPAHPKDGPYGIDAKTAAKPPVGSAAISAAKTPGVGAVLDVLV